MKFSKIRLKMYCISLIIFFSQVIFAKNYFQQQVNYKIDVKLNDSTHTLHAYETIEYTNHSEDALDFIYFHLWPNAYQKNSALDKQLMADGDTKLHFAKLIDKGFIDSLNFTSNSQKLRLDYDTKHHDICKIFLPKPLLPNETIEISTPFFVKIPSAKLSRLGRIGQFYAITQWYPKPAVHDVDGWHQMPYLNQGEFYSEFGNFDVSITLPENYVVGATGDLQTQSEIDFLTVKSNDTTTIKKQEGKLLNAFPSSSKKYKTIRYTQQNVHDFGWFADKRFIVKKSEVKLPHSGNTVTTWAMFTPSNAKSWKKATQYINDAVFYYSKWNGDYPYKHCTAIDGTISAGGGMEYPNITIINSTTDSLQMDIVITHEVGHNWFYGILGSNERLHPWMDEGINSFNEMRYVKTKYPNLILPRMVAPSKTSQNIIGLKKLPGSYFNFYSYWITAKYNADQPIELPSEEFTSSNYGQIVYQKTAASFNLLYSYLGAEMFDSCMHNYFNQWKFKHPQPADIRAVFENTTGKNLAWFFDDIIGTKEKVIVKKSHSDYDRYRKKFNLTLKNEGKISAPTELTFTSKDSVYTKWIEPFKKDTTIIFEPSTSKIIIDKSFAGLNILGSNIELKRSFLFKPHFTRIRNRHIYFFPHATAPNTKNLFVVPVVGYNNSGGIMPGLLLSNGFFPTKKFEWNLDTRFSVSNSHLAGYNFSIRKNFFPNKIFQRITFSFSARHLPYQDSQGRFHELPELKYVAVFGGRNCFELDFNYKTAYNSAYKGGLSIQRTTISNYYNSSTIEFLRFYNLCFRNRLKTGKLVTNLNFNIQPYFDWSYLNDRIYDINLQVVKVNAEVVSKYQFKINRFIRTRLFIGSNIKGKRHQNLVLENSLIGYSFWGNNDYEFKDTYLNRSYNTIQTYINDGGVRNKFSNKLNFCSKLIGFNSSLDLLSNGLLSIYYDIAFTKTFYPIGNLRYKVLDKTSFYPDFVNTPTQKSSNIFYIASGVRIALIPDYVEFYVPFYLYETVQGKRAFKDTWKNVNILINLTKLNPFDAAHKAYD